MNVLYLYLNEYRLDYGNAASLNLSKDICYVLHFSDTDLQLKANTCIIEVGIDGDTRTSQVTTLKVPQKYKRRCEGLIKILKNMDFRTELIITGYNNWLIAKILADKLRAKLLFYFNVAPRILKSNIYLRLGRKYEEIVLAPLSLAHKLVMALSSDYVIVNDKITEHTFNKFLVKKVAYIPPIYSRFLTGSTCQEYILDRQGDIEKLIDVDYILSIIVLRYGKEITYMSKIELEHLINLIKISRYFPHLHFFIVGTSYYDICNMNMRIDIPSNMVLLGKIYDDEALAQLYRNALAVLVLQAIPGVSNRLLEAMFYKKTILTTPIAYKSHLGLRDGFNIIVVNDLTQLFHRLNNILSNVYLRRIVEKNLVRTYRKYYWFSRLKVELNRIL